MGLSELLQGKMDLNEVLPGNMGLNEVLQGKMGLNEVLQAKMGSNEVLQAKMGFNEVLHFVVEKFKLLWLVMVDFWAQFVNWIDKVFPPETRAEKLHHWLAVALPFLIAAAVLFVLYRCCKCCCCSGRGRGIGFKMMKAPGRNFRMPRHVFEASPKSYFQNLRAYPGDHIC